MDPLKKKNLTKKMILVPLSASVERFSVSYMRNFFQGVWNFPRPHEKIQEVTQTLFAWFFSRGYGIFQGPMEKTRRLHKRYYHGFFQGVWNFPGPHGKNQGVSLFHFGHGVKGLDQGTRRNKDESQGTPPTGGQGRPRGHPSDDPCGNTTTPRRGRKGTTAGPQTTPRPRTLQTTSATVTTTRPIWTHGPRPTGKSSVGSRTLFGPGGAQSPDQLPIHTVVPCQPGMQGQQYS